VNNRNQQCLCNSGKKFKRCCGSEAVKAQRFLKDKEMALAVYKSRQEQRQKEIEPWLGKDLPNGPSACRRPFCGLPVLVAVAAAMGPVRQRRKK
jgi:hypothetical protein